jgi:hypothetical protein
MELLQQTTNLSLNQDAQQRTLGVAAMERHYTVSEIAKLWLFSESTIRRLFTKEPGVIKISRLETRQKRGYTTLRIPERIAQRVHQRLQGLA